MTAAQILEEVKRIKAISDIGLLYASNGYEKERHHELREIAFRLLEQLTGHAAHDLKSSFPLVEDYPTAKVDIRAFVLFNKKVLMVREGADGKWALPGGWADIGYSPKETVVKEVKEETGLDVRPLRLLAVYDKKMHSHPPQPFYVYKLVIYCELLTSEIEKGFDVLDVNFFAPHELPELSENRILKTQIERAFQKIIHNDYETDFD
jgi:ADP-ribose pyrophosphatase YjhB (NUDIX family)